MSRFFQKPFRIKILVVSCLLLALVLTTCRCDMPADPKVMDFVQRIDEQQLREYSESLEAIGSRPWYNRPKTEATVEFIENSLRDAGYQVRSAKLADSGEETRYINIIAEIPGVSQPERVVELGAHYDTVPFCPGADDNGSGVAGVLAVARALADAKCAMTIRFCFYCCEESWSKETTGLGSITHVKNILANENETVEGVIVLDTIGYATDGPDSQSTPVRIPLILWPPSTANFVTVIGNFESGPIGNLYEQSARRYVPDLEYYSVNRMGGLFPDGSRSDHSVYWKGGLPGVLLTDSGPFRNTHYHLPSDRVETLNFTFMNQVVQAAAATMLEWAQLEPAASDNRIEAETTNLVYYWEYGDGPTEFSPRKDPAFGMSIGELSLEPACRKIVTNFWNAEIAGNDEMKYKLWPALKAASKKNSPRERLPVEIISVGQPYQHEGCSFGGPTFIVPAQLKYSNDHIYQMELIVLFRDVGTTNSCMIMGQWGSPRKVNAE